jgi:predicted metal-dependent peptidase
MNQQAATHMTRARATLILDQPFFGALALKMPLIEDENVKTMAVNGKNIFYNPTFVNSISPGLRKAIVAHEVMHCVLDHIGRKGARDHKRWNQAGDYSINGVLTAAGFDFEGTGLLNSAYDGMITEAVYDLLPPPDDDGNNGHGDPLDDMLDGPTDPADQSAGQRDWKVATIQAKDAAKIMGKLPVEIERFLDDLLRPQIDWKAVLRQFITERCKDDYSWMRPNRAMLTHGVYIPSLYSESMGDIVLGIDVSGSIGQDVITAFEAECQGIVGELLPANVHVVFCSAHVHKVDTFARHEEFALRPSGSGGTAFKPVFDYVEEKGIRPVCLVYLTDLEGPTNFDPPDYPVLWCCTTEHIGPWGDTVRIEV